ncbi:MAG TPA: contact-dependent growth inhibition system immunity protein [Candidatus Sulfotelmatobacter sp.]|nr:contact-dependent growth inhibition system immunity protein [Candidatus Sulfotelmatobacter sp.]
MSTKRPAKKQPAPQTSETAKTFSAADYPALRRFLRGYFHQDMKDEYGSPEEAVREFREDADEKERAEVAEQWARFLDTTRGRSIEEINRLLTGELGSSYAVTPELAAQMSKLLGH